jgi:hypothetical protein
MTSQLAIKAIEHIEETKPATFEIVVALEDGTMMSLRMDVVTVRSLMVQIVPYAVG